MQGALLQCYVVLLPVGLRLLQRLTHWVSCMGEVIEAQMRNECPSLLMKKMSSAGSVLSFIG